MSKQFVETLHEGYAQSLSVDKVLYDNASKLQHIQVFENRQFGRVLTLDGVVQTTQGDEFIYHEMLTHVPILAHGNACHVLIVGGGDGGMAREVLRHQSVEKVTMVEIDEGVIAFSKTYLPSLSDGAFDDPLKHKCVWESEIMKLRHEKDQWLWGSGNKSPSFIQKFGLQGIQPFGSRSGSGSILESPTNAKPSIWTGSITLSAAGSDSEIEKLKEQLAESERSKKWL